MTKYFPLLLALAGCGAADHSLLTLTPAKPLFDVPALLGKDIDQVLGILGPAQPQDLEPTPAQVQLGATQWDHSFVHDTATLLVSYDARTRQVRDFFLMTQHGTAADYIPLLKLANVKGTEPQLLIQPERVPAPQPLYRGIRFRAAKP